MWLLVFLYFIVTLLISWMLFGYLLLIWFMGRFKERKPLSFPEVWPTMSVVVPCYNEAGGILEKLEDLRRQDYPADRLEVIFCDGGSSDDTVRLLEEAIRADEPIRVIRSPRKGKIHQLNHVLPSLKGDLVVNTDADARLSQDALKWMASEFCANPEVWVVGAYSTPLNTIDIEHYYWDAQNKGRFMESDAETASIVISQCYAFRRELLSAFPDDVVADDIYTAFLGNVKGYRTVYSRYAIAHETRLPQSYEEFLPHKFRKSNAFLRESMRFIYLLPEMKGFLKMLALTRIVQQLLLPWAMLSWVLIACSLLTLFRPDIVVLDVIFLSILFTCTSRVFAWVKLPDGERRYSLPTIIKGYLLTNLVLLATGISYPFFRQWSCYQRLAGCRKAENREEADA